MSSATTTSRVGRLATALVAGALAIGGGGPLRADDADADARPVLRVPQTDDFPVTGDGSHAAWEAAGWTPLNVRPGGTHPYTARVKALHSKTGLYVLFDGSDARLTATFTEDYATLWTEDVFEVFLWTDERHPLYFEYEISPLGYELPILIPNLDGAIMGWRPWMYEGGRKVQKRVSISGGPQQSNADIAGWRAEMFFPYELLKPLRNVPPQPGSQWRANFYRVDYDNGQSTAWDWARVGPSFHEFEKFGTLVFE
ncbi:MAG: carbohydrate-binding family 9-like protein [Planctomyces sp.]|nr:carbohydrate-binding family 9-like protein [Planctomyces sp.]